MKTSKVLVCAATSFEANACRRGLRAADALKQFEVLQTGIGPEPARRALEKRLLSAPRPIAIVSTGFAGSLNQNAPLGAWVWGTTVRNETGDTFKTTSPPTSLLTSSMTTTPGRVLTVSEVTTTDASFRSLGLNFDILDMESFAWAQLAAKISVPFYIIRLISDSEAHPMPDAIRIWSKASTGKTVQKRLSLLKDGLRHFARSPAGTLGFIATSSHLMAELSTGWSTLAHVWRGEISGSYNHENCID